MTIDYKIYYINQKNSHTLHKRSCKFFPKHIYKVVAFNPSQAILRGETKYGMPIKKCNVCL